jgi:photosystem II stability/assembly factor-like uncharacterized protein
MKISLPAILTVAFLAAAPAHAAEKRPSPAPSPSPEGVADDKEKKDTGPLGALEYRLLGPFVGGRVSRVAGVPGDMRTYYAASASGGVWKTTDAGAHWKPVFDDQPISSIGSIAVAPSDPSVVYVGSGEANIRGNVAAGNGIYKSTDAGRTWQHVWTQEGQIGTMVVHPKNPDVAYAAVLGHAFGPNPERGVYRTKDGGRTWDRVLYKDTNTGASDVALDPQNPRIVFAGLWQARRMPWDLQSGGPGSSLYVSRDGGDTWKQLKEKGLPAGPWGKVGVAVAPSDSRRVYALIEADKGGLYRSDNGGESWKLMSDSRGIRQRAWYYTTLTVDPTNPDLVYFPQVPMLKTIDGGRTIVRIKGLHHGDNHDAWVDPRDPRRIIVGSDGGVDLSVDGGESWTSPRLPLGQFYHVAVDTSVPYRVSGSMQDLGTAEGPSNSLTRGGIRQADWWGIGGGEAGHTASDPSDPNVVYAGEYGGYISRFDLRTGQVRNVSVYPANPSGHGVADMKYRFQWTAPIATSPHDPKVVYHGGNVLFRTTDGGETWTAISKDLTRNDVTKQQWAGGPITGDNTGVETYDTIFAVAESPREKGLIWVGTDDGLVQVTRDSGSSWTNVTPKGFPEWATIDAVEPSWFDAGTAWVVADAHRLDDTRPYVFETRDYGQTWRSIAPRPDAGEYVHAIREDPSARGVLYLGTERGVWISRDGGSAWERLKLNLPTVAVHDLRVKDDDLVVATHGRSLWVLDHLASVRGLTTAVRQEPVHLFPPDPATRWRYRSNFFQKGPGENPPYGAVVDYYLKDKPKGEMTLEVLDAQGRLVRTLRSVAEPKEDEGLDADDDDDEPKPALASDPGVQRAVWDLQWTGGEKIKKAKLDAGDPKEGPLAVPGSYTLRLTVDGHTETTAVTVRPDPRVQLTAADYDEALRFGLQLRDDITRLTRLVETLRSVRQQLQGWSQNLASNDTLGPLRASADAIVVKIDALEGRLHNPRAQIVYDILAQKGGAKLYSQMAPLLDAVNESDGRPTQGMRELYAEQVKELDALQAEAKGVLDGDLAGFNAQARAAGVAHVVVAPLRP